MRAASTLQTVLLDELVDEITVGHVGPMATRYEDTGIPFLRSLNVEPYRITSTDLKFISESFHHELKKSALRPGDVVIVRTGKPGTAAVIPDHLPISNCSDLVIVRPSAKLSARFLAYFVNGAAQGQVHSNTVGAVQQHFNVGAARRLELPALSRPEQDAIASVLGALDDRIELNRRMNETLEAMARAIFRDWFVDFGPTRAKATGQPPYLAEDLWSLFPNTLNPQTGLPEGWVERPLAEFFEIIGGGTPKTKEPSFWGGDIPWFSVTDTPTGSDTYLIDTEKRITQAGVDNSSARIVEAGVTIISARGTVGNLAMAGVPTTFNQSCYGLRGVNGFGSAFVFLAAKRMVSQLRAMAHGSVFSTITRRTFENLALADCGMKKAREFEGNVAPLFDRIKANVFHSCALAETRDYLLPKLMCGTVRVTEAERIAAEARA
jgi:type I restriction enzyme, S subunit